MYLKLLMCVHVVFAIHAVSLRTAFDVQYHQPASFCCSLLQSLCLQYHRGYYPVAFGSASFMPPWLFTQCSISLFNTCSGPQISAAPLTLTVCLCVSLLLFCLCGGKKSIIQNFQLSCYTLTPDMPPQCYPWSAVQPGDKQ